MDFLINQMKPTMLEKAIRIALDAHAGQTDKAGREYILHPLRVMMKMDTQKEMIAAVLHDVVEDSSITLADLESYGFESDILEAVSCLTRDPDNETYDQSMARIKQNVLARKVKLADLTDNMDVTRIRKMKKEDLARLKKYNRAWHDLTTTGR